MVEELYSELKLYLELELLDSLPCNSYIPCPTFIPPHRRINTHTHFFPINKPDFIYRNHSFYCALLNFKDKAFFTNWSFVATLQWAKSIYQIAPFFNSICLLFVYCIMHIGHSKCTMAHFGILAKCQTFPTLHLLW